MVAPRVLLLPGLGNSGPAHWQTYWEKRFGYARVMQRDWDHPAPADWIEGLDSALRLADAPTLLVAHSLGCALVVHWARSRAPGPVRGALLVAPADVESEQHTPAEVRSFAPLPRAALPFPAIVVASRTDPYVSFARAEELASSWGASLVDAGRRGHLNADSDLGEWPQGQELLRRLHG